jgi:hypothetical protein
MTDSKALSLMMNLGLDVVSGGPSGRYPIAVPGPKEGFRYWATYTNGEFRFGVKPESNRELTQVDQRKFRNRGSMISPNGAQCIIGTQIYGSGREGSASRQFERHAAVGVENEPL